MARTEEIRVPDIGDFDEVDVIEVLVAPGDEVKEEDGLITLESDKASMDVPSPMAGTVKEVKVAAGGTVKPGDVIAILEVAEDGEAAADEKAEEPPAADAAEKAPAEPAPESGEAPSAEPAEAPDDEAPAEPPAAEEAKKAPAKSAETPVEDTPAEPAPTPAEGTRGESSDASDDTPPAHLDEPIDEAAFAQVYASPSMRRFARELGVDLSNVTGTGRKGRILREDILAYVQARLRRGRERDAAGVGAAGGLGLPDLPAIDFAQWGEVEEEKLSKIQRLTGKNVHRSWITIPHVTQNDEADVTELEAFRKSLAGEGEKRKVKLTPVAFLVKAATAALHDFPRFNSSLAPDGETLVVKKYVHVGIAVDTGGGLVVPVLRDADHKGLWQLAAEIADLAGRARERKLKMEEMQGGTFTISSLGGIGGTGFTPIVNWPEVAILGVSQTAERAVVRDGEIVVRKMLPLSLSYDHRVIDGAAAARFTRHLAELLGDLRRTLL